MDIHVYTWVVTIVVLVGIIVVDGLVLHREEKVPTTAESARATLFYIALACLFGLGIGIFSSWGHSMEYFSGYLLEKSLSVDNLFLFLIILEKQRVPRELQHFALTMGILAALVLRGGFIALGATLIENFAWVFFLFGAYLLYTAYTIMRDYRSHEDESEHKGDDGVFMRWIKKVVPTTGTWEHERLWVKVDGKRAFTLMFFTIASLELADLMFALDSIPAIFGVTQEPYIVFTASIFAMMGLRQLFFLIGDLLEKLQYLSVGLFFLLAFIGIKLILHALHHYEYISWEVPNWASLTFIVIDLGITALVSIWKSKKDAREMLAQTENLM
jgi:tellurite resistance protein TerC